MSSVFSGLVGSSDGRLKDKDNKSPRRRLDSDDRKSDDDELLLECDALVGVAGGVRAPLSCILTESYAPIVDERIRVGESGGVETVRRFAGRESLRSGTLSRYPSLASASVLSCICGLAFFVVKVESRASGPPAKGKTKRGKVAILVTSESCCELLDSMRCCGDVGDVIESLMLENTTRNWAHNDRPYRTVLTQND